MELFELIKINVKKKGVLKFTMEFRKNTIISRDDDLWICSFKTSNNMYSAVSTDPLKAIEKSINLLTEGMKKNV